MLAFNFSFLQCTGHKIHRLGLYVKCYKMLWHKQNRLHTVAIIKVFSEIFNGTPLPDFEHRGSPYKINRMSCVPDLVCEYLYGEDALNAVSAGGGTDFINVQWEEGTPARHVGIARGATRLKKL